MRLLSALAIVATLVAAYKPANGEITAQSSTNKTKTDTNINTGDNSFTFPAEMRGSWSWSTESLCVQYDIDETVLKYSDTDGQTYQYFIKGSEQVGTSFVKPRPASQDKSKHPAFKVYEVWLGGEGSAMTGCFLADVTDGQLAASVIRETCSQAESAAIRTFDCGGCDGTGCIQPQSGYASMTSTSSYLVCVLSMLAALMHHRRNY